MSAAPGLVIDLVTQPPAEGESIPRAPMMAVNKLKVEAALTEVKTITGWILDNRRLTISLPRNKFLAWSIFYRVQL